MTSTRPFRPRLEPLDDRTLPSITLAEGVLTVIGTGAADAITLWKPAADAIRVDIGNTGESRRFAIADVSEIVVRGGPMGDRIILGDGITLPSEVFGARGSDNIR